jgi:hypothetical protein
MTERPRRVMASTKTFAARATSHPGSHFNFRPDIVMPAISFRHSEPRIDARTCSPELLGRCDVIMRPCALPPGRVRVVLLLTARLIDIFAHDFIP